MMRVYFDNAATTRVDPDVLKAMTPYFTGEFGNASSLHSFGRETAKALRAARESVAALINADPDEIIFTAGGTESDNIALKGVAFRNRGKNGHIITSRIEHPAVLETCSHLEKHHGIKVTYVPVDRDGIVDVGKLACAISPETLLVSIMHANNEIGTIEPVGDIGKIAKEHGVPFHTDAVQSVGKVPIDVRRMNIDMLSLSSHKIHGPKGVGALYVRKGLELEPLVHGGGHEGGIRSGTENIPGIAGLGKACELLRARMEGDISHMTSVRDRIISGVLENIDESYLNGHPVKRLPNNASFRFSAIEGESLVLSLDAKGIAASTGSACSSKKLEPSHVLRAIGLSEIESHGSLRVTLSRESTEKEADYFTGELPPIVARLRSISPLWKK
jgi:cysteine desulfurase